MSISAINGQCTQSVNYQKSKIGNNGGNKVSNSANPSFGITPPPSGFDAFVSGLFAHPWSAVGGLAAAAIFAFMVMGSDSNNPLDH